MADTALKFGPEWLRALTEPQVILLFPYKATNFSFWGKKYLHLIFFIFQSYFHILILNFFLYRVIILGGLYVLYFILNRIHLFNPMVNLRIRRIRIFVGLPDPFVTVRYCEGLWDSNSGLTAADSHTVPSGLRRTFINV